jgi:phage terminase Nu1 subunit (DNA packaging protein)
MLTKDDYSELLGLPAAAKPKRRPGRPKAEAPLQKQMKAARTRAANATAALAEMKREVSSGALVRREEVAATWAAIMTDLRAALLGVPARLDCDPATRAAVDREIRDSLNRIADDA